MSDKNQLPVVEIDRSRWGQGLLYDPETGCYCGLGFVLKAFGVGDDLMAYHSGTSRFREQLPEMAQQAIYKQVAEGFWFLRNWVDDVVNVNDNYAPGASVRERKMAAALTGAGFSVKFIN